MGDSVSDTIESLLASVQEEVEDEDLIFKLRTARQLNVISKERGKIAREELAAADLDPEMVENLEKLGYINSAD